MSNRDVSTMVESGRCSMTGRTPLGRATAGTNAVDSITMGIVSPWNISEVLTGWCARRQRPSAIALMDTAAPIVRRIRSSRSTALPWNRAPIRTVSTMTGTDGDRAAGEVGKQPAGDK